MCDDFVTVHVKHLGCKDDVLIVPNAQIVLCSGAAEVADRVHNILTKEDRFDEFRKNGFYRMGPCGAAKRIARQLWMELI